MKKLILLITIAFGVISCNDDNDIINENNNQISSLTVNSNFASLNKEDIAVSFIPLGNTEINTITMNISFNGTVKLNGNVVQGNFTYNTNDEVVLTPNEFGRTTATISLPNENNYRLQNLKYDFYTIDSNSQDSFIFVNNVIQRSSQHSNGQIFYETNDNSSYSVNRVEVVVLSSQSFNLDLEENRPILNETNLNFQGNALLNKFELSLLEQNFGTNNFKFTFDNGQIINLPFTYIKTYQK